MRIPPVVKTLLLLNLAAYIIDIVCQAALDFPLSAFTGLFYVGSPFFKPWQFITYMFMHGSMSHIFFNMFALWMFGRVIEQVFGAKRFLLYYLACGIGAGIVQELGQAFGWIHPAAMTIGASGAVYGILLAFGMTFPNERLFIIPFPFPIKAKYFVMGYAVIELFEGLSTSDGVAHFAHLGGMLVGLMLILYWRKRARGQHLSGGSFWNARTTADDSHSRYWQESSSYDRGQLSGIFESFGKAVREFFATHFGNDRKEDTPSNASASRADDYAYNARKRAESDEIDKILDKIRKNGYAALSDYEKRRLFEVSQK